MTPDKIAKSGSEHAHQTALFAWLAVVKNHGFAAAALWANDMEVNLQAGAPVPDAAWIHAIPNGGSRGDDAKSRMIRGAALKNEGVRPGVADIFWPLPLYPYHGLYIEMKIEKGRISPDQAAFREFVVAKSYAHAYCWNWREAACVIEAYYYGRTFIQNSHDKTGK